LSYWPLSSKVSLKHFEKNIFRVVKVFNEQISTLNVNTRYLHPNIVNYSVRLGNLFPNPLKICVFTCSGSEANEVESKQFEKYFIL